MAAPVSGYLSSSYVPVHGLRTVERALPGAAALFNALHTWNPEITQGSLRFEAGRLQPESSDEMTMSYDSDCTVDGEDGDNEDFDGSEDPGLDAGEEDPGSRARVGRRRTFLAAHVDCSIKQSLCKSQKTGQPIVYSTPAIANGKWLGSFCHGWFVFIIILGRQLTAAETALCNGDTCSLHQCRHYPCPKFGKHAQGYRHCNKKWEIVAMELVPTSGGWLVETDDNSAATGMRHAVRAATPSEVRQYYLERRGTNQLPAFLQGLNEDEFEAALSLESLKAQEARMPARFAMIGRCGGEHLPEARPYEVMTSLKSVSEHQKMRLDLVGLRRNTNIFVPANQDSMPTVFSTGGGHSKDFLYRTRELGFVPHGITTAVQLADDQGGSCILRDITPGLLVASRSAKYGVSVHEGLGWDSSRSKPVFSALVNSPGEGGTLKQTAIAAKRRDASMNTMNRKTYVQLTMPAILCPVVCHVESGKWELSSPETVVTPSQEFHMPVKAQVVEVCPNTDLLRLEAAVEKEAEDEEGSDEEDAVAGAGDRHRYHPARRQAVYVLRDERSPGIVVLEPKEANCRQYANVNGVRVQSRIAEYTVTVDFLSEQHKMARQSLLDIVDGGAATSQLAFYEGGTFHGCLKGTVRCDSVNHTLGGCLATNEAETLAFRMQSPVAITRLPSDSESTVRLSITLAEQGQHADSTRRALRNAAVHALASAVTNDAAATLECGRSCITQVEKETHATTTGGVIDKRHLWRTRSACEALGETIHRGCFNDHTRIQLGKLQCSCGSGGKGGGKASASWYDTHKFQCWPLSFVKLGDDSDSVMAELRASGRARTRSATGTSPIDAERKLAAEKLFDEGAFSEDAKTAIGCENLSGRKTMTVLAYLCDEPVAVAVCRISEEASVFEVAYLTTAIAARRQGVAERLVSHLKDTCMTLLGSGATMIADVLNSSQALAFWHAVGAYPSGCDSKDLQQKLGLLPWVWEEDNADERRPSGRSRSSGNRRSSSSSISPQGSRRSSRSSSSGSDACTDPVVVYHHLETTPILNLVESSEAEDTDEPTLAMELSSAGGNTTEHDEDMDLSSADGDATEHDASKEVVSKELQAELTEGSNEDDASGEEDVAAMDTDDASKELAKGAECNDEDVAAAAAAAYHSLFCANIVSVRGLKREVQAQAAYAEAQRLFTSNNYTKAIPALMSSPFSGVRQETFVMWEGQSCHRYHGRVATTLRIHTGMSFLEIVFWCSQNDGYHDDDMRPATEQYAEARATTTTTTTTATIATTSATTS